MAGQDFDQVNGLIVLKKKHEYIRLIEEMIPDPEIHGTKIWGSSFLIMDYLMDFPPRKKSKITEIGCGWGLLGIFCARHFRSRVTAVDADPNVFAYLDTHAIINEVDIKTVTRRYEELNHKDLRGQEMVLGADICFWDELVDPLYSVVEKAVNAGVDRVVIADPGRDPFFKLSDRCKKDFSGAELYEWDIKKPKKIDGYLLEIESA